MPSAERRRLAWESWLHENAPVRQALYASLLAAGLLAAAAMVRLRQPAGRRRLLLAAMLACLTCLGWSAAALFGQAIRDGAPPVRDGGQGILWLAAVILGLSFFLAVLFRDAFLALAGALLSSIGFLAANRWPLAFAGAWPPLPEGAAGDICLHVQVLILLSAYAALALTWGVAALTLARSLLAAVSSERLCRLAALCLWPVRLAVMLLTASTLLDAYRALEQGAGWHGWNAQAVGTLLVLPGCVFLVCARRRGWIQPFAWMAAVVFGLALLAMTWHAALRGGFGDPHFNSALAADAGFYVAGFLSLSLAAHAALRYYFGKQPYFS